MATVAPSWDRFAAVLFDLDGVLTDTASIHADCWKDMFDAHLREHAGKTGESFRPFDLDSDYHRYVDGKPRFDGARDFLLSRDIHLPDGQPDSPPEEESVWGLANHKNSMANQVIRSQGVDPFPGSVALVHQLREAGIKTAVVSSSSNCQMVLEAAKISHLFDASVDGKVVVSRGLAGKPAPDSYLEAARELGVEAARAVVVEDAISGVQAGRAGKFGLVIGVARKDNAKVLRENGADLVVSDLGELVS